MTLRLLALLVAAPLTLACEQADESKAANAPTHTSEAATEDFGPGKTQIDPDPAPATIPEIVARETISVNDRPACAVTVRYPGHIDQGVTWGGEKCDGINISITSPSELREADQLADLPPDARQDIEGMAQGVLTIGSEFSASAYPLNVYGRVYEVPYID